jgi:hypothetical protein
MPGTEEINAITRKAWRPSPQGEFLEELMAKAEAAMTTEMMREIYKSDLPATHTIVGEPLKPLLAHVAPNGNFNVPVDVEHMQALIRKVTEKVDAATAVARVTRVEDGQVTEITVTGSGTWNEPYVLSQEEPDILSITRDVVRGG